MKTEPNSENFVQGCCVDAEASNLYGTKNLNFRGVKPFKLYAVADRINDPKNKITTAMCSTCGGNFPLEECLTDREGDYENGYYDTHLCPKCDNGGCIDDYC